RRSARSAPVGALGELLDHLLAEGGEVVGLAARYKAILDTDLLVDPVAAGVADVGLDARPRRDRAALQHVRLDQRPGPVAYDRRRLLGIEEALHELDGLGDRP